MSSEQDSPIANTPYQPLKDNEIRLLRVRNRKTLDCELRITYLSDDTDYFCVSYCWGDATAREPIIINGIRHETTKSSAAALRGLPRKWLWIDAICINLKDQAEQARQIAIMGTIYKIARCVTAWLVADIDMAKAELCKKGLDMLSQERPISSITSDEIIVKALEELFKNDYWQRVWHVQELVLAKQRILYYGRLVYSFKTSLGNLQKACFYLARDAAILMDTASAACYHEDHVVRNARTAVQRHVRTAALHTIGLLSGIAATLRPFAYAEPEPGSIFWEIMKPMQLKATRKHDLVYGRLELLPFQIPVDYSLHWKEVWAQATVAWLHWSESLRPLEFALRNDIPTWVVDYEQDSSTRIETRIEATKIVPLYNATLGSTFHLAVQSCSIEVPGVLFDTIEIVAKAKETFNLIPKGSLARILLSDSTTNLALMKTEPHRLTEHLLIEKYGATWEQNELFNAQMRALALECSVFRTRRGFFGRGRPSIVMGDQLLFLATSTVPYCARSSKPNAEKGYKLISSCYVDGLMDGEILQHMQQENESIKVMDDIFEPVTLL